MPSPTNGAADQALMIVLLVANVLVYLTLSGLAAFANRLAGKSIVSARLAGCLAVVALGSCLVWYAYSLIDTASLASSSPYGQGEVIGGILGMAAFPSLLVLAVAAFRAWRQSKKEKSGWTPRAKAQ